jgi:hypothetical protein
MTEYLPPEFLSSFGFVSCMMFLFLRRYVPSGLLWSRTCVLQVGGLCANHSTKKRDHTVVRRHWQITTSPLVRFSEAMQNNASRLCCEVVPWSPTEIWPVSCIIFYLFQHVYASLDFRWASSVGGINRVSQLLAVGCWCYTSVPLELQLCFHSMLKLVA